MKLKLLVLGVSIPFAANAATEVTLQNFSGTTAGRPVVIDNAGTPMPLAEGAWAVGTFDAAFAATLPTLDTLTNDQAVIDAFTQSGASGTFSVAGMFNGTVSADSGNPNADLPIYAVITHSPAGGPVNVMVLDINQAFPTQDGAGNASVDLGRLLAVSDVVYGSPVAADVDTSTLPAPFQSVDFAKGLAFDGIPEPSTGLLSLIAGLGLLARRRR